MSRFYNLWGRIFRGGLDLKLRSGVSTYFGIVVRNFEVLGSMQTQPNRVQRQSWPGLAAGFVQGWGYGDTGWVGSCTPTLIPTGTKMTEQLSNLVRSELTDCFGASKKTKRLFVRTGARNNCCFKIVL